MPKPPFALISDLHANLEATEAVLADIEREGVKDIVCLGDIVGYGPDPDKVVDIVKRRAAVVIAGNHDWAVLNKPHGFNPLARNVIEYTRDMMEPKLYHVFGKTRERWTFLENLAAVIQDGDLTYVHGSLRDPLMDYCFGDRHALWNPAQLDQIFPKVKWLCFCGHTHFPTVIREDKVCWYPAEGRMEHALDRGRKYIINTGSVGQPRDGDPRACYAILTGEAVRYRRVPYDIEKTRGKILAIDAYEKVLADRLQKGK
ncbi:MAG: metallophosphoesterase family protein [Planctomycetes bacterium]|nr:metallophosphoesterase family protein [Planctomycetota bacterium]